MPKRAFNLTIIIDRPEDMPLPHEADVETLLIHKNYDVVDYITSPDNRPIVTIREVAKA
jgi:hypothetical protein